MSNTENLFWASQYRLIIFIGLTILIVISLIAVIRLIKGQLSGKTRILVTHATHFLSEVDRIVVMDTDVLSSCNKTKVVGKISHVGTYPELVAQGVRMYLFSYYHPMLCIFLQICGKWHVFQNYGNFQSSSSMMLRIFRSKIVYFWVC